MHRPRPADRPLVRRDADGSVRAAPSWETLTERLIREAQEAGQFDDLPARGRPLPLDDDRYAGDMASANRLLRNAGAAPPWIETDKRIRDLRVQVERLLARAARSGSSSAPRLTRELDELIDAHDLAVMQLETIAPTPHQQRRHLDRHELRRRLLAQLD